MEKILGVSPQLFEAIRSRRKKFDGRAPEGPNGVPYDDWKVGRRVTVMGESNPPEFLTARVTSIEHFDTVEEMLRVVGVKNLLPDLTEIKDAVKTYNSLPLSYQKRIKDYGIYAIGIEPIED